MSRSDIFRTVEARVPDRNSFDLSFENLMTNDVGPLRPMALYEIVPGDHFRVNTELFARLLPMDKPAFAMLDIYMYWFFVPHRLVWDGFEDFITTGIKGQSQPAFPTISIDYEDQDDQDYFKLGGLNDQFGFPVANDYPDGLVEQLSAYISEPLVRS